MNGHQHRATISRICEWATIGVSNRVAGKCLTNHYAHAYGKNHINHHCRSAPKMNHHRHVSSTQATYEKRSKSKFMHHTLSSHIYNQPLRMNKNDAVANHLWPL